MIMNSISQLSRVLALLFVLFSLGATALPTDRQGEDAKKAERDKLIAVAREIMTAARYCALVTLDSRGRPQVRTMDPFPPDENMVVWLATNPKSAKVAEIRNNPRVALYYFDPAAQGYVTISGIARLVDSREEKAKRWKDEWKAFYPDREKSYLLITVTPEELEVVNEKRGITGDSIRWTPPAVRFRTGRSND